MQSVQVLDSVVTQGRKYEFEDRPRWPDRDWQRLLAFIRERPWTEIENVSHVLVPKPLHGDEPERTRHDGGYLTREAALADQQKKWHEYAGQVERGEIPRHDKPTRQGFMDFLAMRRTTFYDTYRTWGLRFPPTLGFVPDWSPRPVRRRSKGQRKP